MTHSITHIVNGQEVSEVPGQPGRTITGRPTERVEIAEFDIFATIPGAYEDENEVATVECRPCKGRGTVQDTRTAAITHRATTVNRTCRYCHGEGRITPIKAVVEWDSEVGEMPAWMTGADDDTEGAL